MIISFANHKGGVGKSTSVINIGAGLTRLGNKVLLIDFDPQANLTQGLGIVNPEVTIYEIFRGDYSTVINVNDNLDLIPSDINLAGLEVELTYEKNREYRLKNVLKPVAGKYDFILIDYTPKLRTFNRERPDSVKQDNYSCTSAVLCIARAYQAYRCNRTN